MTIEARTRKTSYEIRCLHPEQPRSMETILLKAFMQQDAESRKAQREEDRQRKAMDNEARVKCMMRDLFNPPLPLDKRASVAGFLALHIRDIQKETREACAEAARKSVEFTLMDTILPTLKNISYCACMNAEVKQ
jgi:hypothetical protein